MIRLRSVPGTARDIVSIFFAMAIGLATGMGYLFYTAVFFVIIGTASVTLFSSHFAASRREERFLRITVPENLNYEGAFGDLLKEYTDVYSMEQIKTTNMGSLFEISYRLIMKPKTDRKEFIDGLRCRNGNLNISLSKAQAGKEGLSSL